MKTPWAIRGAGGRPSEASDSSSTSSGCPLRARPMARHFSRCFTGRLRPRENLRENSSAPKWRLRFSFRWVRPSGQQSTPGKRCFRHNHFVFPRQSPPTPSPRVHPGPTSSRNCGEGDFAASLSRKAMARVGVRSESLSSGTPEGFYTFWASLHKKKSSRQTLYFRQRVQQLPKICHWRTMES